MEKKLKEFGYPEKLFEDNFNHKEDNSKQIKLIEDEEKTE
jgi:hypothetical protein